MTNNRVVWLCMLSWVLFWPVALLTPRLYLFDYANAFGLTFGLAVLWRYGPEALLALLDMCRGKMLSRGQMLILGIETTWLAMVGRTMILWIWRWLGEKDGGLDGLNMAFVAWLIITGGAFHLAASAMPDDKKELPRVTARLLKWAGVAGVLLGTGIAAGRWVMQ